MTVTKNTVMTVTLKFKFILSKKRPTNQFLD
jgi:hypothetical protein